MNPTTTDTTTTDWIAQTLEKNPELAKEFDAIVKGLENGNLSLADVGGFTDDELNAAHTCACHHLTIKEPEKALAVISTLLMLDQRRAEYYVTAAIAMHHLERYDEAEVYYATADGLRPDHAVTLMYRGEARVLADDRAAGVPLLKRGIEIATDDVELKPYAHRATRILQIAETK